MTDTAGENNANTVLLLHCDEDLSATAFVDRAVGGSAKTITALGDAQIERVPKWGFGAIGMHGAGSYAKIAPTDDFNFGYDDFALEFWVTPLDPLRAHLFMLAADIDGSPDPDNMLAIERVSSQGSKVALRLHYRVAGVERVPLTETGLLALLGSHSHWALVRVGVYLQLYVAGKRKLNLAAADIDGGPLNIDCSGWDMYIGASFEAGEFKTADAYFDEIRIQVETLWSGSTLSEPTGPYTRRQLGCVAGQYVVRKRHQSQAVGQYGLALRHHRSEAVGVHVVRNRHESSPVGTHGVQQRHYAQVVGTYDVILHRHKSEVVGTHVVRVGHQSEAVGEYRILTTRHQSEVAGAFDVRNRHESEAVGTSRVLARYESEAVGTSRIAESAADRYELYHGIGSIDFTAAPLATSPTLPFDVAITGEGVHHLVVRKRNQYGEQSGNIATTRIELDGADEEIQVAPSAPEWIEAEVAPDYKFRVRAHYAYPIDGDLAADRFLVHWKVDQGEYDDFSVELMVKTDGLARLDWTSIETFLGNKVLVQVRAYHTATQRASEPITSGLIDFLTAGPVPGPVAAVKVENF
jgi:hypothetical protein